MTIQYVGATFAPTTTNGKTGNIPSMSIGSTRAESMATCRAVSCPLLKTQGEGPRKKASLCYAQYGTPGMGHASQVKSAASKGPDIGTTRHAVDAIRRRAWTAKAVRIGVVGNTLHVRRDLLWAFVDTARASGLAVLWYFRGWRSPEAADHRGQAMASCESPAEADEAIALGFRATVVVSSPEDQEALVAGTLRTPEGRKVVDCPANVMVRRGKPGKITCNDCRLCDGSKAGPVIGFDSRMHA